MIKDHNGDPIPTELGFPQEQRLSGTPNTSDFYTCVLRGLRFFVWPVGNNWYVEYQDYDPTVQDDRSISRQFWDGTSGGAMRYEKIPFCPLTLLVVIKDIAKEHGDAEPRPAEAGTVPGDGALQDGEGGASIHRRQHRNMAPLIAMLNQSCPITRAIRRASDNP